MGVPAPLAEPAEPEGEDIPEWLKEMENVVASSEIPAWLNEPVETTSDALPFELEEAPPTPEFVIDAPSAPPEPEPAIASAAPALESARQRRQSGDLAGALAEYESLIRANTALQDCVDDLAHVARLERDNPVVFRVLGDGYMRLGKLQLALDTYREALNHL
jgi:tetratricopeptide (TPR) repeat protein